MLGSLNQHSDEEGWDNIKTKGIAANTTFPPRMQWNLDQTDDVCLIMMGSPVWVLNLKTVRLHQANQHGWLQHRTIGVFN
jgi:hypothetical protein